MIFFGFSILFTGLSFAFNANFYRPETVTDYTFPIAVGSIIFFGILFYAFLSLYIGAIYAIIYKYKTSPEKIKEFKEVLHTLMKGPVEQESDDHEVIDVESFSESQIQ